MFPDSLKDDHDPFSHSGIGVRVAWIARRSEVRKTRLNFASGIGTVAGGREEGKSSRIGPPRAVSAAIAAVQDLGLGNERLAFFSFSLRKGRRLG